MLGGARRAAGGAWQRCRPLPVAHPPPRLRSPPRPRARRAQLGVSDVQISLTSLEEVFLTIARKAELEAAAAEVREAPAPQGPATRPWPTGVHCPLYLCLPVCLPACPKIGLSWRQHSCAVPAPAPLQGQDSVRVELEGGGTLEVPLGEEWASDPATGTNYLIQWTQDDTGSLQARGAAATAGGRPLHAASPGLAHCWQPLTKPPSPRLAGMPLMPRMPLMPLMLPAGSSCCACGAAAGWAGQQRASQRGGPRRRR